MRLTDQILFLINFGDNFFSGLGEAGRDPYNYGDLLAANDRGVRRALARAVVHGEVIKSKGNKYQVSSRGRQRVRDLRPYLFKRTWDKKWRMVVFDVPERYRGIRTVLRRFLLSMGFTAWQRSIWITPFDVSLEVREFIKASSLGKMAYLLEVNKVVGVDSAEVALRAWKLKKLSQDYVDFAQACIKCKRVTSNIQRKFVNFLTDDPFLPAGLLGKVFARNEAMRVYAGLLKRSA
jgi:DNA-binding transcriptional regulator PaaX